MPPELSAISSDPLERLRFMQVSLDHLTDLVVVTDAAPDPTITYVNQAVVERTGFSRQELIGQNPRIFQGIDSCPEAIACMRAAIHRREPVRVELVNYTRDGRPYWVDLHITPVRDEAGVVTHFVSTQSDVTERKQTERELLLFRQAIDQSPSSVIITNRLGHITYVNSGFEANSGYTREEALGLKPGFRAWQPRSEESKRAFWACLLEGHAWRGEFVNRHKDGHRKVKRAMVSPVQAPNGEITHFLSVEQDVSAEKRAQEQLEFLAFHDPVTELPNRRKLVSQLSSVMAQATSGGRTVLIMMDLDGFKRINDAYGHIHGDRLLHAVGRLLLKSLCHPAELVVHLGSSEFCLLWQLENQAEEEELRRRLDGLQQLLSRPFKLDWQTISMTACMGVVWIDSTAETVTSVQRRADLALNRAKQDGPGSYAFFEPELDEAARRRVVLEEGLRLAILRDELSVAVQAQWTPERQLKAGEVLVRWLKGPDGVPVSPAEFIPVAESSGLIKPLTLLVFNKALEAAAELQAMGLDVPLSINFSTELFRDEALINGVLELLDDSGVAADRVMLEITESLLIDTQPWVQANMARLSARGLRFSLDDFGTGYSNLAYLKRMHLSELKIDKRFVDNLPDDDDNRTIVRSILSIARQMKLRVVAEGVETPEQARFLAEHGCDLLQGYLLHCPEAADEWLLSLRRKKSEKK
ncbi:hypothetical protein GCM10009104_18670 [Marinobacterium maritimum]|uniref:PAS domain S-box-containing protein/diguanylate cyclase (GGDEF) domain-containing protein n=1 Tax=Marinobacterium maritimum TaxID=500162 RepID=A0ABP3TCY8_9GAMM